jgi:hypothetical protein
MRGNRPKPHIVYRARCWHVYYCGAWLGSASDPRQLPRITRLEWSP